MKIRMYFSSLCRQNPPTLDKHPLSLQIAATMETILENNILQQTGNVRGNIFSDTQKYQEATKYKSFTYKIYLIFCTKSKVRFEKRNKWNNCDEILERTVWFNNAKTRFSFDVKTFTIDRSRAFNSGEDYHIISRWRSECSTDEYGHSIRYWSRFIFFFC